MGAPDVSQSPSVQALKAKCACREGTHLTVEVVACVLLLGNLPKSLFDYLWGHIKLVRGAFPLRCCHFGWCRAVCRHSLYLCCDSDRHPAGCSPAERCRQRGTAAGSRLVFLRGAQHLRILTLQPERSAAGPAQDATAAQNFPLTVGSGYYYTKQNKLRSLILVYLWIRL